MLSLIILGIVVIKMETLILIAALVYLIHYYCTRNFSYWANKNVIGPKPIPFFGNIKDSALRRKNIGVIYKDIYDQYPDEKVIGFYRMTAPSLIVRDLDVVKDILIKEFDVFPERGVAFSKNGLGDNLFHCNVKTWSTLRKRMTPAFSSTKLKYLYPLFVNHGDKLVHYLQTVIDVEKEQELHQHTQKYTMSTVMAAVLGLDVDLYNNKNGFIERAGHFIFKSTYAAEADMLFPNILKNTDLSLYNNDVNRFCYEVVKLAVEQRKKNLSAANNLMDMMISMMGENINTIKKHGNEEDGNLDFSKHVIAGQVFILFAAGFGNNALSLSYALFQLAQNPDCQEKLQKQIDQVLTKYDGKLSYDALKEMTYLEKVFSEILRMNPLTNAIPRCSKQDYKVPGTDVVIEKGTSVIISPYAIHRDERLYPNPDRFDPERFSQENVNGRHPYAYIPFGFGPRSCLGKRMAQIQFGVALVKILTKFTVTPSEKTKKIEDYDPMRTLIATKGGIYVNLIPRQKL